MWVYWVESLYPWQLTGNWSSEQELLKHILMGFLWIFRPHTAGNHTPDPWVYSTEQMVPPKILQSLVAFCWQYAMMALIRFLRQRWGQLASASFNMFNQYWGLCSINTGAYRSLDGNENQFIPDRNILDHSWGFGQTSITGLLYVFLTSIT